MNKVQREMIQEARRQYKNITPCGNHTTLGDCFTHNNDTLLFWFNTEDQSTHVMSRTTQVSAPAEQ